MQNKNNKRSELIQHYFDTKEYRMCPYGLKKHIRRSDLSSGAKECFHFLLDEATFSEDWSTQISREYVAEEIKKHPNTITKLLTELEKSGYIIREQLPSQASIVYINFPPSLIKDLELSNNRTKKIKQCGTIAKNKIQNFHGKKVTQADMNNFKTHQKQVDDLLKNDYDSLYNINIYNNKIDRVIASKSNKISYVLDHSSSVVNSCDDFVINKLNVSKSQDVGIIASNEIKGSEKEINFFVDEMEEPADIEMKSAEKIKIKRCIDGWQKQLDELPDPYGIQDSSKKYAAIKKHGTLECWIKQYQNKLAQLDKPVKQENIELVNGERRLTEDDCKKLNTVLVKAYRDNKITLKEAKKTLCSMVHGILYGYYCEQNVDVAKSVNSVIKKFKNDEWNNNEANFNDKPNRPQPQWWNAHKKY